MCISGHLLIGGSQKGFNDGGQLIFDDVEVGWHGCKDKNCYQYIILNNKPRHAHIGISTTKIAMCNRWLGAKLFHGKKKCDTCLWNDSNFYWKLLYIPKQTLVSIHQDLFSSHLFIFLNPIHSV